MLIKRAILDRIANGEIDLAFRRWKRPTVKPGSRLRSAVGELLIEDVSDVSMRSITTEDARRAGYEHLADLQKELSRRPDGDVFRISLQYLGGDQREQLRNDDSIHDTECKEIVEKIRRIGRKSPVQDLSMIVLKWIERWPGRRAQDLADEIGIEKAKLKTHIRKLKEFGLTESMATGYRLSLRGRRVLIFCQDRRHCLNDR